MTLASQLGRVGLARSIRRPSARRGRGHEAAHPRRDRPGARRRGDDVRPGDSRAALLPCRRRGRAGSLAAATTSALTHAAFANASFPQALEFDDTHNESIVHMSSPSVAAALALSETRAVTGRELILAIAIANEIACRVGVVAPGQFHRRGFHPTGLFSPFGIAYGAGKLLGLDAQALAWAAGTCGSFAAGTARVLGGRHADEVPALGVRGAERHVRGAARRGRRHRSAEGVRRPVRAVRVAPAGCRGYRSASSAITDGLGTHWESRNSSFKPFPAAHVLHPYISAMLRLRRSRASRPATSRASSARLPSSTCRSCASRSRRSVRRRRRRTAACACSTRWPRRSTREAGRDAYEDANRLEPGDSGAGPHG